MRHEALGATGAWTDTHTRVCASLPSLQSVVRNKITCLIHISVYRRLVVVFTSPFVPMALCANCILPFGLFDHTVVHDSRWARWWWGDELKYCTMQMHHQVGLFANWIINIWNNWSYAMSTVRVWAVCRLFPPMCGDSNATAQGETGTFAGKLSAWKLLYIEQSLFSMHMFLRLNGICVRLCINGVEMECCMNSNLFKNFGKCNGKWKICFHRKLRPKCATSLARNRYVVVDVSLPSATQHIIQTANKPHAEWNAETLLCGNRRGLFSAGSWHTPDETITLACICQHHIASDDPHFCICRPLSRVTHSRKPIRIVGSR